MPCLECRITNGVALRTEIAGELYNQNTIFADSATSRIMPICV